MKRYIFKLFTNDVDANGKKFTTFRLMTGNHHWYDARPRNQEVTDAFNKYSGQVIACNVQRKKVVEKYKNDEVYTDTRLYIESVELPTPDELEVFTEQDNEYNDSTIGEL